MAKNAVSAPDTNPDMKSRKSRTIDFTMKPNEKAKSGLMMESRSIIRVGVVNAESGSKVRSGRNVKAQS